jgi:hypothetical protein
VNSASYSHFNLILLSFWVSRCRLHFDVNFPYITDILHVDAIHRRHRPSPPPSFRVASAEGMLQPIRARPGRFMISLAADDAGILVGLEPHDMRVVCRILQDFGDATGLRTNLSKPESFLIQCT